MSPLWLGLLFGFMLLGESATPCPQSLPWCGHSTLALTPPQLIGLCVCNRQDQKMVVVGFVRSAWALPLGLPFSQGRTGL